MRTIQYIFAGLFNIVKMSHFLNAIPIKIETGIIILEGIEKLKAKYINKCKRSRIAELPLISKANTN